MKQTANKVSMFNTVLQMTDIEICNDERLAQLKGFPFIMIEKLEKVEEEADYIIEVGGVTPAFKRMLEEITKK